jgi:hypothetical protein
MRTFRLPSGRHWERQRCPRVRGITPEALKILDGHNRYEICTRLNIDFDIVVAEEVSTRADAIQWIGANQLGRRNLTPSQKAAFGLAMEEQLAEEAKKRLRLNNASKAELPYSQKGQARDKAAEVVGVSPRYISEAKAIKEKAPVTPRQRNDSTTTP